MGGNDTTGVIKTAWQMPHPPVAVPEVGRGREREIIGTLEAMRTASDSIAGCGADTIVIISPHAGSYGGRLTIDGRKTLNGDLSRFGAKKARVGFEGDGALAGRICDEARLAGIKAVPAENMTDLVPNFRGKDAELDHGTVVPLYFIRESIEKKGAVQPKLVVVSVAFLTNAELFEFGRCIARAVKKSGVKAALITSGDLSHKLTEDGPYGYDAAGPAFDKIILESINAQDTDRLLRMDAIMLEQAAQCGFYGLLMVYGALSETPDEAPEAAADGNADSVASASPRVLSYEGIFGVGYAVARIL